MWKLWIPRKKDYEGKLKDLSESIKSCSRKRRNLERFSISATYFILKALFLVYGILSSILFYYTHNWWMVIAFFVSSILTFWFLRNVLRWFVANRATLYVSERKRLKEEMRELLSEAQEECNYNTMTRLMAKYSFILKNDMRDDEDDKELSRTDINTNSRDIHNNIADTNNNNNNNNNNTRQQLSLSSNSINNINKTNTSNTIPKTKTKKNTGSKSLNSTDITTSKNQSFNNNNKKVSTQNDPAEISNTTIQKQQQQQQQQQQQPNQQQQQQQSIQQQQQQQKNRVRVVHPHPTMPAMKRTILEQIMDIVVGQAPQYCYALICQHCSQHNGLMMKEFFESKPQIEFTCSLCGYRNIMKHHRTYSQRQSVSPQEPTEESSSPSSSSPSSSSPSSSISLSEESSSSNFAPQRRRNETIETSSTKNLKSEDDVKMQENNEKLKNE